MRISVFCRIRTNCCDLNDYFSVTCPPAALRVCYLFNDEFTRGADNDICLITIRIERSDNVRCIIKIHTNKVGLVTGYIQLCKLYIGFRFLFKVILIEIDIYY